MERGLLGDVSESKKEASSGLSYLLSLSQNRGHPLRYLTYQVNQSLNFVLLIAISFKKFFEMYENGYISTENSMKYQAADLFVKTYKFEH